MLSFLLPRAFQTALLLLLGSMLTFAMLDLAPGDYFDAARLDPRLSPETLAAIRLEMGAGAPLYVRYEHWLSSIARGTGGYSFAYRLPVAGLVRPRLFNTLLLNVPALLLAWCVALPCGVWMATRPRGWLDRVGELLSSLAMTVPEVIAASILLLIAARTGWLPAGGMESPGAGSMTEPAWVFDLLRHALIPWSVLFAGMTPWILRHARAAALAAAADPFVEAVRMRGIEGPRLWFGHILPAAAPPLIALAGVSLPGVLSASLLVEVTTGWPGLGPLLLEAISARDPYLVMGPLSLAAVLIALSNLAADAALYWADPRIRGVEGR